MEVSESTEAGSHPSHLRVVSDAAYKKEVEDGYSMRGELFCRGIGHKAEDFSGSKAIVHVVDWACKSQRHVTRSTFSAELLSAGDAADQGILISHMLYELEHGPMSPLEARNRRMQGGHTPIALYLDAMSVFAAITATFIKRPAEKSLLCHVQYLRELLDKLVLKYLFWIDTRDMGADGLTKGACARQLLHMYMEGYMPLQHEFSQWCNKGAWWMEVCLPKSTKAPSSTNAKVIWLMRTILVCVSL